MVGRSKAWLLAFVGASGAFAADAQRFVISQANPQLPVIAAYLDVVDDAGQPISDLTPANFSAALGANRLAVTEIKPFQETGEGVAYTFLIDISKSISRAQFGEMRTAIQTWIAGLKSADRAAIGTFGESYQLLTDFTGDKQKLTAAMEGLAPRDLHTRLYLALDRAVEFEQRTDPSLPVRRAIVLLSDGKDEGSALAPEDVVVKVRASRLPIYTIGLSRLPPPGKRHYLDVLHRFSNVSGGLYEEAGNESVPQLYAAIQQAILRVFVVRLGCQQCPADGRSYPLEVTLAQGTRGLKAIPLEIVPLPGAAAPPPPSVKALPWWNRIPLWVWLLAAVAALGAAGYTIVRRRRSSSKPIPDDGGKGRLGWIAAEIRGKGTQLPEPEPGDGKSLKLEVVMGKDAGSSHELRLLNKALIGRSSDCDIVVADPEVSNHHCELALVSGHVLVCDLGSMNSTYVNGVPIRERHKLEPRDTILVGDTELRVHFEES